MLCAASSICNGHQGWECVWQVCMYSGARRNDGSAGRNSAGNDGAGEGNRTPDLRFTKPLLYRLSYAGQPAAWAVTSGTTLAPRAKLDRLQAVFDRVLSAARKPLNPPTEGDLARRLLRRDRRATT